MKTKLLIAGLSAGLFFSGNALGQAFLYDASDPNISLTTSDTAMPSPVSGTYALYVGGGTSQVYDATDRVPFVYPNPVTSHTNIVLGETPVGKVYVEVIGLNGNTLRRYIYEPGTYQLDVDMSRLPMGIYSVRVFGKDISLKNLKIVKD